MQTEINSLIKDGNNYRAVQIFGYRTNGLPGLEIVGPSSKSRLVKEKIIYYSRLARVSPPIKRFVLALEIPRGAHRISQFEDVELGFLIMYWWLCESLPLNQLAKVWAWGRLDPTRFVFQSRVDQEMFPLDHTLIWAGDQNTCYPYHKVISPKDLFSAFPQISFCTSETKQQWA